MVYITNPIFISRDYSTTIIFNNFVLNEERKNKTNLNLKKDMALRWYYMCCVILMTAGL